MGESSHNCKYGTRHINHIPWVYHPRTVNTVDESLLWLPAHTSPVYHTQGCIATICKAAS